MKNIVHRVTGKYMRLNRRRTAITFAGILFMVILMTCVFAGKKTVLDYLEKVASLDKGSWHLTAYDLTAGEAEQIAAMKETAKIGLSEQLGHLDFPQSGKPGQKPFLDIRAYSPASFEMIHIELAEGRFPQNRNELIISEAVRIDGSEIKVGDTLAGELFGRTITGIDPGVTETIFPFDGITLHYGETVEVPVGFMPWQENTTYVENKAPTGETGNFTVVGIMKTPTFEKLSGASYAAICGMDGSGSGARSLNALILLDTEKTTDINSVLKRIQEIAGEDTKLARNEMLLTVSQLSTDSSIGMMILFIEAFFTVFIMAASVILIYNVFNMSYAERTRYLGMLSSAGATGKQKRQSIYYECMVLLLPALPAGILLGMLIVKGAMQLLKPRLDSIVDIVRVGAAGDIPVTLSVDVRAICLIIGMSILTVMISALIPAVKVSRIGTAESARGNAGIATKKRFRTRKGLLEKGRPELLLAVNSTGRLRHLSRSVVRSIAVFAVLTTVTLYGAQSVIRIVEAKTAESGWVPEMEGYNYALFMEKDKAVHYDRIRMLLEQDEEVTGVKEFEELFWEAAVDVSLMSEEYLNGYREIFLQYADNTEEMWEQYMDRALGDNIWLRILVVDDQEYALLAGRGDADMTIATDIAEPSMLVYNDMHFSTDEYKMGASLKGYRYIDIENVLKAEKGDWVPVWRYSSEKEDMVDVPVRVAGFLDREAVAGRFRIVADAPMVFMNHAALEKLREIGPVRLDTLMILGTDKENDTELLRTLADICEESRNDPQQGEIILMNSDVIDTPQNIKQAISEIIKILAWCFTAFISAVCLLNLYNSIEGRAAERKRENAILRSAGMTARQLRKMYDLENMMLLARGLGIAAVICAVLSTVLARAITGYFGSIRLQVPWLLIACIAACICAASQLFTRMCFRNAGRDSIVEEIRRETV